MTGALVGAGAGIAIGLAAAPLCVRLPRGIPERLAQPAWTRHVGRPVVLAGVGGLAGLVVGVATDSWVALLTGLILVAVLVPATAIDVAWRVVPDSLLVAGAAATGAILLAGRPGDLVEHGIAAAAAGGGALALAVAARGGFGLGDVKLLALLGLALGGGVLPATTVAIGLAGVAGVALLIARGRGATVPLVPFLAVGALAAVVGVRPPLPWA